MIKRNKEIKNILLVLPEYSSFYPMMVSALDELKIKYSVFDNRKTSYLEKVIFLGSKYLPILKYRNVSIMNKRLIKKIKEQKPDLVLVVKGENILKDTVDEVKKYSLIINWFPDYLKDFSYLEESIPSYHLFLHADRFEVSKYRKKGYYNFYRLAWAGTKIEDFPKEKDLDVVFIGAFNKDREKLFLPLKKLNFKIWGNNKWGESKLAKSYTGKWITTEETLDIIKRAKIVVNQHQNKFKENSMLNLRVYETTSCKSLLLTDFWGDLSKFYDIGKEVLVYKDSQDLYSKVVKYLKNDKAREKISEAGYKKTFRYHTYTNRFEELFRLIDRSLT